MTLGEVSELLEQETVFVDCGLVEAPRSSISY
jgi:hypothetical protein